MCRRRPDVPRTEERGTSVQMDRNERDAKKRWTYRAFDRFQELVEPLDLTLVRRKEPEPLEEGSRRDRAQVDVPLDELERRYWPRRKRWQRRRVMRVEVVVRVLFRPAVRRKGTAIVRVDAVRVRAMRRLPDLLPSREEDRPFWIEVRLELEEAPDLTVRVGRLDTGDPARLPAAGNAGRQGEGDEPDVLLPI